MHIGIVGGLERNEQQYVAVAKRHGHRLECHAGHMEGRGEAALQSLVERSDLVIVLTDVNSHAAMWRARRLAKLKGRRCLLVRRCSPARLRDVFQSLDLAPTG